MFKQSESGSVLSLKLTMLQK